MKAGKSKITVPKKNVNFKKPCTDLATLRVYRISDFDSRSAA